MKVIASLCLALAAAFAVAQQGAQNDKQQKQDKETKEDEPLFTKKSGYKSSTNTKESATLGFNGIDPNGKVSSSLLAATPGSAEADKAKKMADNVPRREMLLAFLKEGGLKSQ